MISRHTIYLIDWSQEKDLEQLNSHSRYIGKQLPLIKILKHNDHLNSNRGSYPRALFAQLILKFFHGFTLRYFSFSWYTSKTGQLFLFSPDVTFHSQRSSKNQKEKSPLKTKSHHLTYFQTIMNIIIQLSFYGSTKEFKL